MLARMPRCGLATINLSSFPVPGWESATGFLTRAAFAGVIWMLTCLGTAPALVSREDGMKSTPGPVHGFTSSKPPWTSSSIPVQKLAASESRKTAGRSGSPLARP